MFTLPPRRLKLGSRVTVFAFNDRLLTEDANVLVTVKLEALL